MTTQNVNVLSPVGYLNTVTGHLWSLTEQPEAIMRSGLYEPLVLSREALAIVQQKDALQLSVDNIMNAFVITGDGAISQLVINKFLSVVEENVALKGLIEQHAGGFVVCQNCSHEEPSDTDDIISLYRSAETPATDAAIANTQAGALDVFADAAEAELAKGKVSADVIDTGFNLGAEAMISMMRMSALALRAGRKG